MASLVKRIKRECHREPESISTFPANKNLRPFTLLVEWAPRDELDRTEEALSFTGEAAAIRTKLATEDKPLRWRGTVPLARDADEADKLAFDSCTEGPADGSIGSRRDTELRSLPHNDLGRGAGGDVDPPGMWVSARFTGEELGKEAASSDDSAVDADTDGLREDELAVERPSVLFGRERKLARIDLIKEDPRERVGEACCSVADTGGSSCVSKTESWCSAIFSVG
jgi:hypothetical protein